MRISSKYLNNIGDIGRIRKELEWVDMNYLEFTPLLDDTLLNLNYNTLYILRQPSTQGWLYFLLFRTTAYFSETSIYFGQSAYTMINLNYHTQTGWYLQGTSRTIWSEEKVRGMRLNTGFFFDKVQWPHRTWEIAQVPSRVYFMNWIMNNPLEVKG